MINRAEVISLNTSFYKELTNIKQTIINNSFPKHIVDEEIKLV